MFKNSIQVAVLVLLAFVLPAPAQNMPMLAQNIHLVKGWNAFYLKGTPLESPDRLFAGWPVDTVGLYDAAAFTATRQFAAGLDTEGVSAIGMRVWRRGEPEASTLKVLHGNAVYLCKATAAFSTTIHSIPEAMRLSWHPTTDENAVLNYVGVSLARPDSTANLANYFSGLATGSTFKKSIYGKVTDNDGPKPSPVDVATAGDGAVIVMDARTAGDWSGVLYVSPAVSVTFSTNLLTTSVSVRNDGATARTVRLTMQLGAAANALSIPPLPRVLWRDMSSATGWNPNHWLAAASSSSTPQPERRLDPGENWTISLALDRTQFNGIAKGLMYGGLLKFEDVDGGSGFATYIPLTAISDGGEAMRTSWPAGLWLCEAKLNEVRNLPRQPQEGEAGSAAAVIVETDNARAGGAMRVRLPIHVDSAGNICLMQRVSVVSRIDAGGTASVGLYAPGARHPEDSVEQMRISSVVLPTDLGVLAPKTDGVEARFGYETVFDFTVAETSKVNPFRHALHPEHDGLGKDFSTPTPSGDDFRNYVSTVKPELFSIGNEIDLLWDDNEAGTWTPDETLHGTCSWTLRNLRHETDIQLRGPFTMQRISKDPVLNR